MEPVTTLTPELTLNPAPVDIVDLPASQNPNQLPLTDLEGEINPWTKEFLKKYTTANDAIALPVSEKKEFVKNYYVADGGYEEKLEKMIEDAENTIETELENEDEAKRLSEKFFYSLINLAKGRTLDELIKIVEIFYTARRKTVKGNNFMIIFSKVKHFVFFILKKDFFLFKLKLKLKLIFLIGMDIDDPITIHITQQCFNRIATELPDVICKECESECKSRDLPLERIMPVVTNILLSDLGQFVDIERLYILKVVQENKDKPVTHAQIKDYIMYSLALSHKLINGKLNPDMMMLLPHILSDTLFNKTGFEGEEVVYHVQEFLKEDKLNEELIDLIIREAYAVEQGKEKSYKAFEEQMKAMEQMFEAQGGHPGMMPGQSPMQGIMPGQPPMPGMMPGMMPEMQGMQGMMPEMQGMMPGQPPMPGMPQMMPPPMMPESTDLQKSKLSEDELYMKFMELMQTSKFSNPMEDPEVQKMMKDNMPSPQEMGMQPGMNPMAFDPVFVEKAKAKEEEFIAALPKEYVEKLDKEKEQILKMNAEFEKQYKERQQQMTAGIKK